MGYRVTSLYTATPLNPVYVFCNSGQEKVQATPFEGTESPAAIP